MRDSEKINALLTDKQRIVGMIGLLHIVVRVVHTVVVHVQTVLKIGVHHFNQNNLKNR